MSNDEDLSATTSMSQPFSTKMHILLVDNEKESLLSTARILGSCSYKVTIVDFASHAQLMLSEGNECFNLVMANVHLQDIYQLLEAANHLCVPIILLSSDSNPDMARTAIERGAILFLQIPTTIEVLKYLWQIVFCDKRRRVTQITLKGKEKDENKVLLEEENIICNDDGDDGVKIQRVSTDFMLKKKELTKWTKELHAKFLDAVSHLDRDKCRPKEILQLMNVPGLTRMQVASHLQKCRKCDWKFSNGHNITSSNGPNSSLNVYGAHPMNKSMPRLFSMMPQEENVSKWKSDYQYQSFPLEAPGLWYRGHTNLEGNSEEHGEYGLISRYGMSNIVANGEDDLASQYGMTNIKAIGENDFASQYGVPNVQSSGEGGLISQYAIRNIEVNDKADVVSQYMMPNIEPIGEDCFVSHYGMPNLDVDGENGLVSQFGMPNIETNRENGMVHQYGMPNICNGENNYLAHVGSSMVAHPQHQLHETYENFGYQINYGMKNCNLQSQISSSSQSPNLAVLDSIQPCMKKGLPLTNNNEVESKRLLKDFDRKQS